MLTLPIVLTIIGIIVYHWIADFVLQTSADAVGKSKSWYHLLSHTTIYSVCWFLPAIIYCGLVNSAWMMLFPIITWILHTATDYYTSRANSQLWNEGMEKKDLHGFFVSIGFDQVLHYIQLFLTYYFLSNA